MITAEEIALQIVVAAINKIEPEVLIGPDAKVDAETVGKTYAGLYSYVLPIVYKALTAN